MSGLLAKLSKRLNDDQVNKVLEPRPELVEATLIEMVKRATSCSVTTPERIAHLREVLAPFAKDAAWHEHPPQYFPVDCLVPYIGSTETHRDARQEAAKQVLRPHAQHYATKNPVTKIPPTCTEVESKLDSWLSTIALKYGPSQDELKRFRDVLRPFAQVAVEIANWQRNSHLIDCTSQDEHLSRITYEANRRHGRTVVSTRMRARLSV